MAGPEHVLNGGIIAPLMDCHSVSTAVARSGGKDRATGEIVTVQVPATRLG